MAGEDEIRDFLQKHNLQQYFDKFIELVYDDLNQLQEMLTDELKEVAKDAGMLKPGHQKRFVAAIQILQSKATHGEPSRNQNDERAIDEDIASTPNITAWPQIAQDLWVPNPLTERLKFYNDVLTSLFETTYHLVAPIQFTSYVIEQRITRWKIETAVRRLENKTENMFDKNSKDGNAMNVQTFSAESFNIRIGDKSKAESAKCIVDGMVVEMNSLIDDIIKLRSSLFNKQNEVKVWKNNELKYYDDMITQVKKLLVLLEKCQSSIISNINLLKRRIPCAADSSKEIQRKRKRTYENKQKAIKRKLKRLHKNSNEVLKIMTNGKVEDHCSLKNGSRSPLKVHELEKRKS